MIDISQPQLAQISCRNSVGMIAYVIEYFGNKALSALFEGILEKTTRISTNYQYLGSPLTLAYFKNENNWYSNEINLKIFDNLSAMGIDAFNTGRHTVISAGKTKNIATIAYLQMLGPEKIFKKINQFNSLYNRTKVINLSKIEANSVTLKIVYNSPHNAQVTQQNIGSYVGGMEVAGLKNITWNIESDDFTELNHTIIKFHWQATSRLQKLRWLIERKIAFYFCKTYLRSDAVIEDFHKHIVLSFENEIAEKEIQRNKSDTYYNQLLEQQENKEQELNQLVKAKTKQLAQSLKDKEKLFENFSHELKTPLTLIIGPIEQLLKQPLSHDILQQLQGVNSNAHRLFELVTALLDLAEIKLNRDKTVATDIYSSTTSIINSLQLLADTKNADISLNYQCEKDLTLKLQAQTWELILSNLLSNAIKHGQNYNKISLVISQSEQQLQLTVADNNRPIPKNEQQKIDARFSTSKSNERGHGLGLAIVHELITAHNGIFSLTTAEKGNQFTICLPLALRTSTKPASLELIDENHLSDGVLVAQSQPAKQLPEILLVEDNQELADFLISSFKPYVTIYHCVNGQKAMQCLDERLFDLILSDVMMPIMDGFEFCRQVKMNETLQHIPFILLTAKSNIESQKQGLSLQVDDYIGKPFNTDILIQKVMNMIKTYQCHAKWVKQQLFFTGGDTSSKTAGGNTDQYEQNLLLQKLNVLLKKNHVNADIKVADIAKYLHISERTLNRKLQAIVGTTATELLRQYRLNQAKRQLEQGIKAKEVYVNCGFNSLSYFNRCFKSQFNVPPAEYQKAYNDSELVS